MFSRLGNRLAATLDTSRDRKSGRGSQLPLRTRRMCPHPRPAGPPGVVLSSWTPKHPGSPQWRHCNRTSMGLPLWGPSALCGPNSTSLLLTCRDPSVHCSMDNSCLASGRFQVQPRTMSPANPRTMSPVNPRMMSPSPAGGACPGRWARARLGPGRVSQWGLGDCPPPPCFPGAPPRALLWHRPSAAPSCLPSTPPGSLCSGVFCLNLESKPRL